MTKIALVINAKRGDYMKVTNENVKKLSDFEINHAIFQLEKEQFKRKLGQALKDCKFNGSGLRQLVSEFMEETS